MWRGSKAIASACLLFLAVCAPARATAVPPSITSGGASAVTATDATLEAKIDPGSSAAGAYYQFQISTQPSEFADEIFCPPPPGSGPFLPCIGPQSATALPIGHISSGEGEVVSLDLEKAGMSLKPGTAYYFRAVAASAIQSEDTIEWEKPVVGGGASMFTTLPCPGGSSSGLDPGTQPQGVAPSPRRHRHHHHRRHHRRVSAAGISRARVAL